MAELVQSAEPVFLPVQSEDTVAALCHKLRTPLTAALGFVQLALREARGEPEQEDQVPMLEMVDQQLRRMSSMIDEVAEGLSS